MASYISIVYKHHPETGTLQPLDAAFLPCCREMLPVPPAAAEREAWDAGQG